MSQWVFQLWPHFYSVKQLWVLHHMFLLELNVSYEKKNCVIKFYFNLSNILEVASWRLTAH